MGGLKSKLDRNERREARGKRNGKEKTTKIPSAEGWGGGDLPRQDVNNKNPLAKQSISSKRGKRKKKKGGGSSGGKVLKISLRVKVNEKGKWGGV